MHLWAVDPWMVTKENMGDNVGQGGQMGKSGRHERCIDFLSFSLFFFLSKDNVCA